MAGLSYGTQIEKDADKALLDRARDQLDITPSVMKLDDCGLWRLHGKRGSITTWGDGQHYLLSLYARTARAWGYAKKRLDFATVTQNAEVEGILRFALPVTVEQAGEIRDLAGLRRQASEEFRAAMSERAKLQFRPKAEGQISAKDARSAGDLDVEAA